MNRKVIIIVLTIVTTLTVAAVAWYVVSRQQSGEKECMEEEPPQTNVHHVYEDGFPSADPIMVGRWQNGDNPQWFKVYYDDYDDEGYFWGKEWDESDDVQEYDLQYHGNGWFRWRKDGKTLLELHAMESVGGIVTKTYEVQIAKDGSLSLTDSSPRKNHYRFTRAE